MKNDSLTKIREVISECQTIVICGHTNPDGDAIGACLGLGLALKAAGKQVQVLLEKYAPKYQVIPGGHLVCDKSLVGTPELFIALDCGDIDRLEGIEDIFQRAAITVNMDHHASNTYFADYNYVQGKASSASEIVYHLLEDYLPLNQDIASALYAGLIYDTGGFRHSSTAPSSMRMAAKLMQQDIPFTKIYNALFDSRSFSEIKLMGRAIDRAETFFDNRMILSYMGMADIAELNGSSHELDAIINYLKGVEGTKIACFLYEKNEQDVKASFRGNDGYDVCALAQKFGGGGHVKAAGCTITAPMEQARAMVLAEIEKML